VVCRRGLHKHADLELYAKAYEAEG
jgi:hypothetical protein